MTWFKGDDSIPFHIKFITLRRQRYGKQAMGDWFVAACWCAGQLTDGFLPEDARLELRITPKSCELLIDAGLWEERIEGFQFHNWLKYQPSKAEVYARRAADAKRQAKGRASQVSRRDSERPDPARPDPTPTTGESTPRTHSLQVDRFRAYEHMGDWFLDQGEARPSLVGKALDEFAARAAVIANAHGCTLETAVYRLCAAAHASDDKFVWAVRDCPVPKPVVNIYEKHDREQGNG